MSISLQSLNSSKWVVFYLYSYGYMHKLLHTCKCPSSLFTGKGHLQKGFFTFMSGNNCINQNWKWNKHKPKINKDQYQPKQLQFFFQMSSPFSVYLRTSINPLYLIKENFRAVSVKISKFSQEFYFCLQNCFFDISNCFYATPITILVPLWRYFCANSALFPNVTQEIKSASCSPSRLYLLFTASIYLATAISLSF